MDEQMENRPTAGRTGTASVGTEVVGRRALVDDRTDAKRALRYSVDVENDLLVRIDLWAGHNSPFEERQGYLTISYLNELPEPDDRFAEPADVSAPPGATPQEATILWPLLLIDTNNGQSKLDTTAEAATGFKRG